MKIGLYILLLLIGTCSWGQFNYRFKNLTINDGLSQSSVTTLIQDELNALWIGTQDGLNRYDGKSFEVFSSDNTDGLESEYILCSLKDAEENLWFGTSNGLTSYNIRNESFNTYSPKKGQSYFINDIQIASNDQLWIACAQRGLYKFDKKKKEFENYSNILPSKKVSAVLVVKGKGILVATEDKGLFYWEKGMGAAQKIKIEKDGPEELTINKLYLESENRAVLATNLGVFNLDIRSKKAQKKLPFFERSQGTQNVTDLLYVDGVGWMFCTSNNGLFVVNDDKTIHHSTEDLFQKSALLFNELNTIYKDGSGTVWLGSKRGLSSFNPFYKGFLGVGPSGNAEKGLPTASVWSFAESTTGDYLFIGTDRAVSRLNRETGRFTQYTRTQKSLTNESVGTAVLAIEAVDEKRLIVGCTDGLFILNIDRDDYTYKRLKVTKENARPHRLIYSIVHWKGSLYWVGTKDGALLLNLGDNSLIPFEHNANLPEQTISQGNCRVVFKDLNNRIWFATSTGGLSILSSANDQPMIRPYEHNYIIKSASTDHISSIYQSAKGEYWFGTSGSGLLRWNERTKRVKIYGKKHGLSNNVVYGVVSGGKGHLWLSTNKGLCNFDINKETAKVYTEVDGLMSNEFNLGAFLESSTGELFFGGIYGYNYFLPKDLLSREKNVSVVFTKFKLENEWLTPKSPYSPLEEPVFMTEEINLSYKQHSFTIRFQPSDLSYPELINYKYELDGSDEGEIILGSLNEIHFNSLSHGEYTLKVYARLGDGKWSTHPATMKITIATPFWLTWWFWVVFAVIVAVAIRIFIRMRIEASRREQVRLAVKVRDRTREIKIQNKKIESQKRKIEEEKNKVLKQQKLLQIEKDKTEKLLKNVIPESTAEELKKRGKARARAYKTVSVLFTDFVGFTNISERMTATELVKKLDVYFTKFDEIIVKNNLEKIKTIGDAYMCAGGVPVRNNTNPIDAVTAAVQIQAYMQKRKNDAIANGREYWELRLGINTGEVTAGVIGSERLAYDIWGATVNQAQRMEMLGEPGKVTITGATFSHIEPYFECTFRGKAQTKSRGLVDMYVVERIKPELSEKGEGIVPNKRFNQIVNLHHYSSINYYKAERHIMKVLEQGLSKKLYYHSIAHTKDVVSAVERLALLENVTDEGLFLLKSAATYHDAGFVEQYDSNEPVGARLADEILPKYGYTQKHIERIKELIYVTQIPHQPKDKLEEIICDADLDYLGRDDFHEIADRLKRELMEHGKIESDKQWDEIQVQFLTRHVYFTKTANKTRAKKKAQNLEEVKERLKQNAY